MSDQPDRDDDPEDRLGRGPRESQVAKALAAGAERRRRDRGVQDVERGSGVDVDR